MTQKRWDAAQDELFEVLQRYSFDRNYELVMLGALVEHYILQEEDYARAPLAELFIGTLREHLGISAPAGPHGVG